MSTHPVLLEVQDLKTHFFLRDRVLAAVDGVSFSVPKARTVCVVGESGSGKSITARSILGLVDEPGRVVGGHVWWHGRKPSAEATGRLARDADRRDYTDATDTEAPLDLLAIPPKSETMRRMRGPEISMVFQEPMASLSPMYSIGDQLAEAIRLHVDVGKKEAWSMGVSLLDKVGIARPQERMKAYSFQLSGGMCQRAMIAIALCCRPALLIADEPTTALDVTTQARILRLLQDLQAEYGMSILFITHDLGVVAEIADDVVVMRRGLIVETGLVDDIFHAPQHPYTRELLAAIPKMTRYETLAEGAP
jgi:peptide/nickel transport system ATP-binding protein